MSICGRRAWANPAQALYLTLTTQLTLMWCGWSSSMVTRRRCSGTRPRGGSPRAVPLLAEPPVVATGRGVGEGAPDTVQAPAMPRRSGQANLAPSRQPFAQDQIGQNCPALAASEVVGIPVGVSICGRPQQVNGETHRRQRIARSYQHPTVRSHLDRIRDKTGCRRRADLTRLALTQGLVWPDLPSAHLWVVLPRPPQRRQKG